MSPAEQNQIIQTLKSRIQAAKRRRKLSAQDLVMLDVMELMLIYIESDHQKVETMWTFYRPIAWASVVALGTGISVLVSQLLQQ